MQTEISKRIDRVMVCADYILRNYRYTLWLLVVLASAWMISDAIRDIQIQAATPAPVDIIEAPATINIAAEQVQEAGTPMAIFAPPVIEKKKAKAKSAPLAPAMSAKVYKTGNEEVDAYIKRFIGVARVERQKFGIPIAIKLGQGIFESRYGTSNTAKRANNHFGMKCWDGCASFINVYDDHPSDKFKIYASAWESWRDHSVKLTGSRYAHLHKLKPTDYKAWARGLKKAGYATDKRYAEKLIKIIERYDLHKYDLDYSAGR